MDIHTVKFWFLIAVILILLILKIIKLFYSISKLFYYISSRTLKKEMEQNHNIRIIDMRSSEIAAKRPVPGAIVLDISENYDSINEIPKLIPDKNTHIAVVTDTVSISEIIKKLLNDLEYKNIKILKDTKYLEHKIFY